MSTQTRQADDGSLSTVHMLTLFLPLVLGSVVLALLATALSNLFNFI